MLYDLHFDEDNCPYGDDAMSCNFIIKSEKDIDVKKLFEEIDTFKQQMDDFDFGNDDGDEDFENEIYDEYGDYGWDEKIYEAVRLASEKHPEWEIEMVDVETYSFLIN